MCRVCGVTVRTDCEAKVHELADVAPVLAIARKIKSPKKFWR